jgi:RNA polymerase sigma factor (sigma-70 family)
LSPFRKSDSALARRAAKGDEQAFAEIFERFGQELYRYARAILGSPEDAQDALQNTMARVMRALPGEQRQIALRPWLYRVTRNEALNLIRSRQDAVEFTDELTPLEPAADIRAEHREAVRSLVRDLASLPELQRSALVLHELSGLSHDEISEALQRSPRASRQAVYEARLALQELKEGRDMDCDLVRIAISDGDGRVLRGRKIRAHLSDCESCAGFALAMSERRIHLGFLAPPLPAAAAAGLVASVLGGGAATGGLLGASSSAVGVVTGTAAMKSIAAVGAGMAIGLGGAKVAGVDLQLPGEAKPRPLQEVNLGETPAGDQQRATATEGKGPPAGAGREEAGERQPGAGSGQNGRPGQERGRGTEEPAPAGGQGASGSGNAPSQSNAGGASADASAGSRRPQAPPGQADDPGGPPPHSNSGSSGGPPAHAGPPPRSNAGGNGNAGN